MAVIHTSHFGLQWFPAGSSPHSSSYKEWWSQNLLMLVAHYSTGLSSCSSSPFVLSCWGNSWWNMPKLSDSEGAIWTEVKIKGLLWEIALSSNKAEGVVGSLPVYHCEHLINGLSEWRKMINNWLFHHPVLRPFHIAVPFFSTFQCTLTSTWLFFLMAFYQFWGNLTVQHICTSKHWRGWGHFRKFWEMSVGAATKCLPLDWSLSQNDERLQASPSKMEATVSEWVFLCRQKDGVSWPLVIYLLL